MTDANRLDALRSAHLADGQRRSARHSVRVEDYLEVLHELELVEGRAKSARIAEHLSVARPTVTKMLKRMAVDGLVEYERYRGAQLTEAGRKAAVGLRERHGLIVRFLQVLGVDEETAHTDTEAVYYTPLLAHETSLHLVCRLLLENKKTKPKTSTPSFV